MKKRLQVLGNSLALVIDKPIRKILGIGRKTILEVSTDGQRILIEPTGELYAPVFTATKVDARRVFDTLVHRYGMWQPQFDQLSPIKKRIMAYAGGLDVGHDDDDTLITMKRLEVCLRQRMANAEWDEAIRVALEKVPRVAAA